MQILALEQILGAVLQTAPKCFPKLSNVLEQSARLLQQSHYSKYLMRVDLSV